MGATMRRVIIESPYAGNIELNTSYARLAMKDSLDRGEAPLASHLLYTQMLNDTVPEERKRGINAGLTWMLQAELVVFYTDLGWSSGMLNALRFAREHGLTIRSRSIYSTEEKNGTDI